MDEYWHKFALKEIDARRAKLTPWEKQFIEDIRPRINVEMFLGAEDEKRLLEIHAKVTDIPRCLR